MPTVQRYLAGTTRLAGELLLLGVQLSSWRAVLAHLYSPTNMEREMHRTPESYLVQFLFHSVYSNHDFRDRVNGSVFNARVLSLNSKIASQKITDQYHLSKAVCKCGMFVDVAIGSLLEKKISCFELRAFDSLVSLQHLSSTMRSDMSLML